MMVEVEMVKPSDAWDKDMDKNKKKKKKRFMTIYQTADSGH